MFHDKHREWLIQSQLEYEGLRPWIACRETGGQLERL